MPSVPSVSVLFRRRLGFKLFLSYLVVVLVAGIVLASTAELIVPGAFERHLAAMSAMMAIMMGGQELEHDLLNNFRAAVTEALTLAGIARRATPPLPASSGTPAAAGP